MLAHTSEFLSRNCILLIAATPLQRTIYTSTSVDKYNNVDLAILLKGSYYQWLVVLYNGKLYSDHFKLSVKKTKK